jgi:hypothetical protein
MECWLTTELGIISRVFELSTAGGQQKARQIEKGTNEH